MEKLIFIVDDNDTNLETTAAILEAEFRVMTMPSAVGMFGLLKKRIPDLILLDVEMPEIGGLDAIASLQGNPEWKDIPVVFLTGWYDEGLVADAMDLGALEVLSKPVNPSTLLECVKKYI